MGQSAENITALREFKISQFELAPFVISNLCIMTSFRLWVCGSELEAGIHISPNCGRKGKLIISEWVTPTVSRVLSVISVWCQAETEKFQSNAKMRSLPFFYYELVQGNPQRKTRYSLLCGFGVRANSSTVTSGAAALRLSRWVT